MNFSKEQITKWALFGAVVIGGGLFVVPILLKIAIDVLTLAIIGIVLAATWFTLPGICEVFAQMGWRLYEFAIRADPISKLKRQLIEFDKQIEKTEEHISEASASHQDLRNTLRKERVHLSEEEVAEFEEQISMLNVAGKEMIEMRNQAIAERDMFAREIRAAEAKYRIGNAMKSALSALSLAKKSGKDGMASQIALDEVQKRLSQSQARLNTMLTRPKGSSMGMRGSGNAAPKMAAQTHSSSAGFSQQRIEDRSSLNDSMGFMSPMHMNSTMMAQSDTHRVHDNHRHEAHHCRSDDNRGNYGHHSHSHSDCSAGSSSLDSGSSSSSSSDSGSSSSSFD